MKQALALLFALVSAVSLSAGVFITSFGSDDFADLSSPSLVQTASTGRFEGDLLTAYIGGDFASVDITGFTGALALTATVWENPATGFQLWLYDSEFNSYVYDGNWSDFTTGAESTVVLNAQVGQTGAFDFTQVQGLDFFFDAGLGGETFNVTFDTLSAVPEPSTYAVLAGLVCLGYGVIRRRRKAA